MFKFFKPKEELEKKTERDISLDRVVEVYHEVWNNADSATHILLTDDNGTIRHEWLNIRYIKDLTETKLVRVSEPDSRSYHYELRLPLSTILGWI